MDTRKITNIAVLAAIALILMILIQIQFAFLTYEPGDIPILIIAFLYGPAAAVGASFVLSFLMAIFTGLGGPFGAFMHFLATGVFTGLAGYFYHKNHSKIGAAKGLIIGSLAMTIIMVIANLLLDPIFYGIPRAQVMNFLFPVIIPFNLTKGLLNSAITVLVYKKLANFLRAKSLISSQKTI